MQAEKKAHLPSISKKCTFKCFCFSGSKQFFVLLYHPERDLQLSIQRDFKDCVGVYGEGQHFRVHNNRCSFINLSIISIEEKFHETKIAHNPKY